MFIFHRGTRICPSPDLQGTNGGQNSRKHLQMHGKENGTYLLLSKFEEDVVFEYHITIQDEDFNLGILTMRTPEGVFEADFDA